MVLSAKPRPYKLLNLYIAPLWKICCAKPFHINYSLHYVLRTVLFRQLSFYHVLIWAVQSPKLSRLQTGSIFRGYKRVQSSEPCRYKRFNLKNDFLIVKNSSVRGLLLLWLCWLHLGHYGPDCILGFTGSIIFWALWTRYI